MSLGENELLLSKIEKIVAGLEGDLRKAFALEGLYLAMNQSDELFKVGNKKEGTHGLDLVNNAIVENLILCLNRIFDNGSPTKERACLKALFQIFDQNPWLVEYYSDQARKWPGHSENNYLRTKESLNEIRESYRFLLSSPDCLHQIESLEAFRHKFLGHTLISEYSHSPKHHFIEDLIREVSPIIKTLSVCLKGRHSDYEEVREIRFNEGQGFVKILIRGFSSGE